MTPYGRFDSDPSLTWNSYNNKDEYNIYSGGYFEPGTARLYLAPNVFCGPERRKAARGKRRSRGRVVED
ncbi:hypothetical protein DPMN_024561 [Dreissena polymorpha]|uniref:Uncharacterized protein n=1 Tax=Dreissena polymorpha TaxID=45954 RepID=A0A9D4LPY7_DREPO|nr:hypothetical protein DPMN_024561 [Dreissena polymorpha]